MNIKIGRNDPCPCGSGKKHKKCCIQNENQMIPSFHKDKEGLHALLPDEPPSDEELEAATKKYQEEIKNSLAWAETVKAYGEEKAKELLKEFKSN